MLSGVQGAQSTVQSSIQSILLSPTAQIPLIDDDTFPAGSGIQVDIS
jgi:hypothetical protein